MSIDREKVLQAAQKYVEKRRYDRAIAEYQKIVQEDPTDARILLKIGDLQARMDAYPDAIATYERVARFYASQGFSVKAIAVYKQIRELIRKHVPKLADEYGHIIPKLAELYQQLGLTGDALSAYDEYATHLQRAGREREAIDVFRKIVEINGNNPLTRLRLAEALLRENKSDDALSEFSSAAEILMGMGRRDDALKVFERMVYYRPDPALARRTAEMYLERAQANDCMMALAKLQICFQADQRDLVTLDLLARAFVGIGQSPKAVEVRKEMVRIAREQGKHDLSQQILQQLLIEAPADETVRGLLRSVSPQNSGSTSTSAAAILAPPAAIRMPRPPASSDAMIEVSEEDAAEDLGLEDVESDDELESADAYSIQPSFEPPSPEELLRDADALSAIDPGDPESDYASMRGRPSRFGAGAVVVDDNLEAVEDVGARQSFDAEQHARDVLSNAEAFAKVGLYAKAIESLRIGLELNPRAIELHCSLRDMLLSTGDIEGAVDEMMNVAAMYLDALDGESAAAALGDVLALDPAHVEARQMLSDLGYEVPEPPVEEPVAEPVPEEVYDYAGQDVPSEAQDDQYANSQWNQQSDEPLPSYDLEGINPDQLIAAVPRSSAHSVADGLLTTDDPFAAMDSGSPAPQSFGRDAPLPSFPFIEDRGQSQGSDQEGESQERGQAFDDTYVESADNALAAAAASGVQASASEPAAPPLAGTRAFQGGESLEDALEEAEFFASRGLFDDAMAILEEQMARFPNHPLLLERVREIRESRAVTSGSGEHALPQNRSSIAASAVEDHSFDIAASLDTLDMDSMLPDGKAEAQVSNPVDVEEVFAKFKEGVRKQVADSDSATHYDLGVAYKEMGLLKDSISEFEVAARDPARECVCRSMIGVVHLELGETDEAITSFIRGLHAEAKTLDQELAIYYELGNIYEIRDNPKEAIYYFQKIAQRDPGFRDVSARVRALQGQDAPPIRAAVGEDDFDGVFDELISGHKVP